MSVDALCIFWRFQALAISPPPMMAMIPRIATTANISTRLNPLRERGRSTLRRGRASGRVTLIMQNPPFLKRGPCRNPVLTAKRLVAAILHPVLSRPTAPVASVDSTLFVTPAARPRTILVPRARGPVGSDRRPWRRADGPREAARPALGAGRRRSASGPQVDERGAEEGAPREVPRDRQARRRVDRLDGARAGPRDPDGGSRDPQEAPRPRGARSARSAPEDALGGRAARRHALPEGAGWAAARPVSAGDRIPRRRLRPPRRSRARPGASRSGALQPRARPPGPRPRPPRRSRAPPGPSRRGGLRHRAPGAHRVESRRAGAGPEGRQRDELRRRSL